MYLLTFSMGVIITLLWFRHYSGKDSASLLTSIVITPPPTEKTKITNYGQKSTEITEPKSQTLGDKNHQIKGNKNHETSQV